jgi:sigma-B regulation protein RsbU (phosphoserine phosphatase)
MEPDSIPSSTLQAALASDLLFFAVASVTMAGGLSSLLLARLKFRDRLLLYLGLFAVLYASLLFLRNPLIHHCLNFLVPIPYALTARELLGPGWRKSISLWLWIQAAFAVFAISFTVFERRPQRIYVVYLSFVIGGTVLVLLHAIFRHKSADAIAKSLRWPLIVFCASVLISPTVEPLGFLVLIVGLGVAAFQHVSARERKLLQVEQELATAWRIQSSIIPRLAPELTGVRIAMRYQPMTSVAGDFYDFLQTSENSVTILIADVSGHGVPAALVASMLKICFAAQRERANNPAGILASNKCNAREQFG